MSVAPPRQEASPATVAELAARVARLEGELQTMTERVQRLDDMAAAGGVFVPAGATYDPSLGRPVGRDGPARVVTHIGQALIALGVGYLLRALTDAELVAPSVGITIGLVYAVGWLGVSTLVRRRGDRLGAGFAGVLAPMLAFPLISEAALRFHLWSANSALVVLAAVTAAAIVTATANVQQTIAWVAAIGAGGTAVVLMVGMRAYVAAEVFFIALGIGTLWLGYLRDWRLLRWPAALVADLLAVVLVLRALDADAHESPYAVMSVLLVLMASYPLSIIIRTVVLNRDVVLFEIAQSIALLALLRGALALSPLIGSARPLLGSAVLGLGVAVSAAAVTFAQRQRASTLNAHFYATVGTVLLMVGGAILLDGTPLALFWSTGAVMLAALAFRPRRATFMAHATVLALAAAWPSHLFAYATQALAGAGAAGLGAPPVTALGVCVLLVLLSCMVLRPDDPSTDVLRRATALLATAAALWGLAGFATGIGTSIVASMWGAVSPSKIATIRTVALSCAACVAAGAGRLPSLGMAAWLSYPFLLFVAMKLVAEDLRTDRPLALFIALGVYGAALIVSARLGRRQAA